MFYRHFSPFPQRKWRVCLFLLRLGGIHPWQHRQQWHETVATRPSGVVEVRGVSINGAHNLVHAPFGGFKESGIGRENGEWGMLEFSEVQAIAWSG